MFAADKRSAQNNSRGQRDWRVSESTLLLLAAIGGSAGAVAGQYFLRHKTRKQPFGSMLFGIVVLHVAGASFLFFRMFAKS